MAWFVLFALIIAAPFALLAWRRRDSGPGEDGTDPHANRNYPAEGGPTPHHGGPGTGTDNWGGGGDISGTV
jgi:hypothetical protein